MSSTHSPEEKSTSIEPATDAPVSTDAPVLPHATEKTQSDDKPPLYVAGWGVMGQSTPDVATGSTPVTRHDDL